MTRTTCNNNNNTYAGIALESECNDVCGYDHNRLRCRRTVAHQRFTRRNSKFLHIDDLYRSDSTLTKLFLKINDIALNQTLNNLRRSSLPTDTPESATMTRHKMLRRQTSMFDKLKSPASPTNSDSYFHLRPRRHASFVNNFVDSSGDDDSNSLKPIRELRSTNKVLLAALQTTTPEQKVWDSGRPKRQIKPKRYSIDERQVDNNKNCFKVEVKKNNKLKIPNNNKQKISLQKNHMSDTDDDDKAYLAKNKKKRESELTRLNNEAENFLFPKIKDESSSVDSESNLNLDDIRTNINSNNKSDINGSNTTKLNKNFKFMHEEESRDSTSSDTSDRRRKRRLTQAEAFILDNQQYYKFETLGSRLRYHGSYLPPVAEPSTIPTATSTTPTLTETTCNFFRKNNGDLVSKHLKSEEPTKKVKKKYNLDKLNFSFEMVPNYETWYETFQRQDTGEERYVSCCSYRSENKNILLPYEMGYIAPLNPRSCYYTYQEVKKSFLGESPSSRTICSTPDSCSLDMTSKTDDTSTGDDTRSSADFHTNLDSPFRIRKRKRGRPRHIIIGAPSKTPRKSPREHASTLAILSSLIQPRRRKPKLVLPSIEEEKKDSKGDISEITAFFNSCLDDLDPVEVESEAVDCNIHCQSSVVETLQEYLDMPIKPKSISKLLLDRKTVRKKRTNKTGWPNKSKRSVFKKEGSHSSGSIIDSTDNNSSQGKLNISIKTEIVTTKPDIVNDENSAGDRTNCVNIDLVKWENPEQVLSAKLRSDFQPVVRVQKLTNNVIERRKPTVPSCSRPKRKNNSNILPSSPNNSPRILRRPKDKLIN